MKTVLSLRKHHYTKTVATIAIALGIISAMYPQIASANPGFGVSPPYVQNYHLLPGSHYEGTVYLVTSDIEEQWSVNISIDAPDIEGWLSIDPGESFLWPLGVSQLPFKVIVDVPEDAELGTYTGQITATRCPYPRPPGDVVICIGVVIDITLVVTDEEFFDFTVRYLWQVNTEEGWPIKFGLRVENMGNINLSPTKVRFDVLGDYPPHAPLQSAEDTTLDLIEPFTTKDIIVEFATTYLPIREHYFCTIAVYTVYNGTEIVWNSSLWGFSVSNNPPNTPSNPSPPDNAAASPVTLGWTGGDPDQGDTVAYDVYFGTSEAPALVSYQQSATNHDLGILEPNIDYYWKVVATDSHGVIIEGPLWDFTTVQHTLTVDVMGNGSVSKNPEQTTYTPGTEIELTATPDPGWRFNVWSGDMVGTTNPATITMNGDYSVTANFVAVHNLTTSSTAGGNVTAPGEGSFTYDTGTVVNLATTPDPGYRFVSWTGSVSEIGNVTASSTNITMSDDYSITANFEVIPPVPAVQYNLSVISTTGGTVMTPGVGSFTYDEGTVVNLLATPAGGYQFLNWTGNVTAIGNVTAATTTITMNDNYSIMANFASTGWCFIATAAYGTPMAKEIQILRDFRDEYLLTNPLGQAFVGFYYKFSPPIAEFITNHPSLKPVVRAGLAPAVALSTVVVNTSEAQKMAILGLLVLVSVIVAIWAMRRRDKGPDYT